MPSSDTQFKPGNKMAPGRGRPKGSVNIYSNKSVKKLEELGFDPIAKMVEQYDRLSEMLLQMQLNGKGSTIAASQLESTIERIANNLIRYGYARVPEVVHVDNAEGSDGLKIKLTDSEEK
jgi:hypothetical protein